MSESSGNGGHHVPTIEHAAIGAAKHAASATAGYAKQKIGQARFVGGKVASAGSAASHKIRQSVDAGLTNIGLTNQPVKVRRGWDAAGLGLSVASGGLAAAYFSGHGAKGFVGSQVASHAIDALGVSANIASVAGRGNAKGRARQGARQEARNFILGNAVYAAGVVGLKRNRSALAGQVKRVAQWGKKFT